MIDIIIAGFASFLFGWQWFRHFGKTWRKEAHIRKSKMKKSSFFINLISLIVTAFVLGELVNYAVSIYRALLIGALIWIGFMVPVRIHQPLWEKKSWKFFAINSGYDLISIIIMSLIIFLV